MKTIAIFTSHAQRKPLQFLVIDAGKDNVFTRFHVQRADGEALTTRGRVACFKVVSAALEFAKEEVNIHITNNLAV